MLATLRAQTNHVICIVTQAASWFRLTLQALQQRDSHVLLIL